MNGNPRNWIIYALSDPRTMLVRYIGVTSRRTTKRLTEHLSRAKKQRKTHRDCWIWHLSQLGIKPILSILESGHWTDWQGREKYWIACYRKFGDLVNHTDGGEGTPGLKLSQAQIENLRAKLTGQKYAPGRRSAMLGKHHTEEARLKIGEASVGRHHTLSTRKKMSIIAAGRDMSKCIAASIIRRKGKHLSPEHRMKIAATTANRRPVICLETGENFPSITAAALFLKVSEASVYQAIRKGCRCRGRRFAYAIQ